MPDKRSQQISIRDAGLEDLDAILKIENLCFSQDKAYPLNLFLYYLIIPEYHFFVAERGKTLSGFIIGGEREGADAWIITLDVHPSERKQGIGESLVYRLEGAFQEARIGRVRLQVGVRNISALNLYKKLGYCRISTLRAYYANNEDAYIMSKLIGK